VVGKEGGMNPTVIETLASVGLGFLGSLIVMLVANWLQAGREARRIADQRRYEWVKERLDKVDDYISRLSLTSYQLKDAAMGVLLWTPIWWQKPRLERPQITGTAQHYLDALARALEQGEAFRNQPPETVFGSLEPQTLGRVYELHQSFSRLWEACSLLSYERKEVIEHARDSHDLGPMQAWEKHNHAEVINEYATFEKTYGQLVNAMRRALALENGYRLPSLVQRLREWWGRRGG